MAKILVLLLFLIPSFVSKAQTCQISSVGDTVEAISAELIANNTAKVTISNDSSDIAANVTVTIEVTYVSSFNNSKQTKDYSAKCMIKAQEAKELIIPIDSKLESDNRSIPFSVKVLSITGSKCQ